MLLLTHQSTRIIHELYFPFTYQDPSHLLTLLLLTYLLYQPTSTYCMGQLLIRVLGYFSSTNYVRCCSLPYQPISHPRTRLLFIPFLGYVSLTNYATSHSHTSQHLIHQLGYFSFTYQTTSHSPTRLHFIHNLCYISSTTGTEAFSRPLTSVADPCLELMDPDPSIFIIDLQDANKKLI